jgi:prepilin-type N-terminal cleavage/methylation domain-containing protein/prepilin-type processing-associated H-X9-DG protein
LGIDPIPKVAGSEAEQGHNEKIMSQRLRAETTALPGFALVPAAAIVPVFRNFSYRFNSFPGRLLINSPGVSRRGARMLTQRVCPPRRGFTLIELLVVMAIMGVLAGMLMQGVQKARQAANRISCANNLRNIGFSLVAYADATGGYPKAARLPSQNPLNLPTIRYLVSEPGDTTGRQFRCPNDLKRFPTEGTSYDYNVTRAAGWTNDTLMNRYAKQGGTSAFNLMYDYDAVHGLPNAIHNRNILYADGHVAY